jgi:hypothetical protein
VIEDNQIVKAQSAIYFKRDNEKWGRKGGGRGVRSTSTGIMKSEAENEEFLPSTSTGIMRSEKENEEEV